ncbi:hypothetical protein ACFLSF_02760 [Candidatus Bipolaricaulota bacterium]
MIATDNEERKIPPHPFKGVPVQGPRREFGKLLYRGYGLVRRICREREFTCELDPVLDYKELQATVGGGMIVYLRECDELPHPNRLRDWCRAYARSCGYSGSNTAGTTFDEFDRQENANLLRSAQPLDARTDVYDVGEDSISFGDDDGDWEITDEEQLDTLAAHGLSRNDPLYPYTDTSDLADLFWEMVEDEDPELARRLDDMGWGLSFADLADLWDLPGKQAAHRYVKGELRDRLCQVADGRVVEILCRLVGVDWTDVVSIPLPQHSFLEGGS